MRRGLTVFLSAVIVIGLMICAASRAADPPDTPDAAGAPDAASAPAASPAEDTPKLELQVAALTTLDELDVTAEQLKQLTAMAEDTAATPTAGSGPKGSSEYHTALAALRDALAGGQDDKVDDAQEKVDDLRDAQNIDPTVDYDITDTAKTKAAGALKLMGTNQIASYISMHSDEVPDATDTILDAIDKCKDATDTDYASLRDEAAQQVGLLAAGFDQTAAEAIGQKVTDLLDKARKMPQRQFDARRGELEHEAHQITKSIDSFAALRHWMAREMADLLSNPQIKTVLAARQKSQDQG